MKAKLIFIYIAACVTGIGFSACSEDAEMRPLEKPIVNVDSHSFNTLSFAWDRIDNAVQYGYQLQNPSGEPIRTGVVNTTAVTLTDLEPATTYTLNVWAYAGINSGFTTAPQVVLTATTDPLTELAVPQVSLSGSTSGTFDFSWAPVANADAYAYKLTGEDYIKMDTVSSLSVTIKNLNSGDYEFSVAALSYEPGYSDSDYSAPIPFSITRVSLWQVEGTYYSYAYDSTWKASLVAYDDGTYSILSWYGVDGYDFSFSINNSGEYGPFQMECGTFDSSSWLYSVPTGLADLPQLDVYPYYDYSYMTGNESAGKININHWYSGNYVNDYFEWSSTTDALAGTYTNILSGWEILYDNSGNSYWSAVSQTTPVTISPIDDNRVYIEGLFASDYYGSLGLYATVDLSSMTITIDPQQYGYYQFAGDNSETEAVIGTITDDMNIVFRNFNLWYDWGGNYGWDYYLSDMKATLIKD